MKRRQSQSYKFKGFAKQFIILKQTLHATHLLNLLDKMCKYEMDPTSIVEDTELTRFCPQTDRRTYGQTDKVKPLYPPFNFVEAGGMQMLEVVDIHSEGWQRHIVSIVAADAPAMARREQPWHSHIDVVWRKMWTSPFYIVNVMTTNALVTTGARTLPTMILTWFDCNNLRSAPTGMTLNMLELCREMIHTL